MAVNENSELAMFHAFVGERLAGAPELSPEEALELWRAVHPTSAEYDETVLALKESLADLEAGDRGRPYDEFVQELRQHLRKAN